MGARPEAMRITSGEGLATTITAVEELGSDSFLYCATELSGTGHSITVRTGGLSEAKPGERVVLAPDLGALHLFDEASGRRLPE